MASAQRVAARSRAINGGGTAAAALPDLLRSIPAEAAGAARELTERAGRLLGTPVTALGCADGRWTVLAGPGDAGGLGPGAGEGPGQVVSPDGTVALRWDAPPVERPGRRLLLQQACVWLALLVRAGADGTAAPAGTVAEESVAVQEVVQQLLSARDVDQVLTSVSERTLRLLDSDICGVMLLEDDVVRMRACVGNRVAETARLAMHRGQGLAGRVFDTGRPGKVDSYLEDRTISADFMSLAEKEETR